MHSPAPPPQSVGRILRTLEVLAQSRTGETLSELARALDAPKNSLVTLLAGLVEASYVTRDESALYRIGPAGFSLAAQITGSMKLPGLVRPALQRLMVATGETALAGVLSPGENSVIYVEKAESLNPMRYTVPVGEHRELHCTAMGKLALACMPPEQLQRSLDLVSLEPATSTTITSRRSLLAALTKIRANGVAVSHEERVVGASGVAAPLLAPDGRFVAGLMVIGPTARIKPRMREFTLALTQEARSLSLLIASAPGAFKNSPDGDVLAKTTRRRAQRDPNR